MAKARKYAYLLLVIIATMITPPDIVSDLVVTVPLFLLFEISLLLSARTYRKMERRRLEEERLEAEREKDM